MHRLSYNKKYQNKAVIAEGVRLSTTHHEEYISTNTFNPTKLQIDSLLKCYVYWVACVYIRISY